MKKIFFIALLAISVCAQAQNLIPFPKVYQKISDKVLPVKKTTKSIDQKLPVEGYTIRFEKGKLNIVGGSDQALVWADATLAQLYDNGKLPEVYIEDQPAFPIRAFLYDAGRNFMEVDMIKQYLDLLSKYKINAFHWHLTDNPAWRIECRVFPQLNDPKFQRKGRDEGKFYTYDQIRDVIKYAKERGIMVIPEIDMPGHSKFFNDTFGFSMDSKEGMAVLEKCLEEFFSEISIEDCPYFHVGSDEVHVKDPKGFMAWSESIAAKYNRKAIAWDPGLPAAETTIRQVWNEAEVENFTSINKPGSYLDSYMGYLNFYDPLMFVSKVFLHKPCGVVEANEKAIGGDLCLWNDVRVADKSKLLTHNGVVSALMAYAERFWRGGLVNHKGAPTLLPDPKSEEGKSLAEFEKRMLWHKHNMVNVDDMPWTPNSQIEWNVSQPVPMGVDTANLQWNKAWGGTVDVNAFCKKYGFKETDSMFIYGKTKIFANQDTTIKAFLGFEVSARSNRKGNGIGLDGQWEADGKLFVNGTQINPPYKWNEPGKYNYKFHTWHKPQEEEPYTDEQLYWMRKPLEIQLKKGENVIEIVSPKWFRNQNWTFSFMPIVEL